MRIASVKLDSGDGKGGRWTNSGGRTLDWGKGRVRGRAGLYRQRGAGGTLFGSVEVKRWPNEGAPSKRARYSVERSNVDDPLCCGPAKSFGGTAGDSGPDVIM